MCVVFSLYQYCCNCKSQIYIIKTFQNLKTKLVQTEFEQKRKSKQAHHEGKLKVEIFVSHHQQ